MSATPLAADTPIEQPGMDPVTFEVLRNALVNVTEEMALTIRRAAGASGVDGDHRPDVDPRIRAGAL